MYHLYMYTSTLIEQFNVRFKAKKGQVERSGRWLIVLSLVVAAMLGAVTFTALFHVNIFLTALVFVAGIIVDAQINMEKIPDLLSLLFIRNLFAGLEATEITNELKKNGVIQDSEAEQYTDKWLVMRREYFSDNPKASKQDFLRSLQASRDLVEGSEHERFVHFCIQSERLFLARRRRRSPSILFKKILVVLGLPLSLTAGLGLGSIAYTSFYGLLGLLGVSAAALPFLWTTLAISVALVAGIFWTATMFKTLYSAVNDNIFKDIAHKLGYDWSGFREASIWKKIGMFAQASMKYLVTSILAILGISAVIASVGAYGSAIMEVFSFLPQVVIFVIGIAMLPVRTLFALEHAVGAVGEIAEACNKFFRWLGKRSFVQHTVALKNWFATKFMDAPLRKTSIAILGSIFFAATILHVLAEAALDMGGSNSNTFWQRLMQRLHISYQAVGRAITAIARVFHVTGQQFIVLIQSGIEFLEHADFAFKQTPKMINAFVPEAPVKLENVQKIQKDRVVDSDNLQDSASKSKESNDKGFQKSGPDEIEPPSCTAH